MLYRPTRAFASIHTKFCVIGGGSGGLNMACHLLKDLQAKGDVRMFQPSPLHYYLSGFTLIGADLMKSSVATRENSKIIPGGIHVTPLAVKKIVGERNEVVTSNDDIFTYDHLIVSSGVKNDWQKIKGAREALDDPNSPVCSVYRLEYAEKARKLGNSFKGGRAIFTDPRHPIRSCTSPQQMMYLMADKWTNKVKAEIFYHTANQQLFKVPIYNNELLRIANEYNANIRYRSELVQVKKDDRIAVFKQEDGTLREENYDYLHLVPSSSPHSYIDESGLADSAGYCDVSEHFMQHKKFPNIWSIGDASSIPCQKSAAALYTQTDLFIKNLKIVLRGGVPEYSYDGYSSGPIYVGKNKAILAEYKYGDVSDMTFISTQQKPSRIVYAIGKDFFPFAYWRYVPQGIWLGKSGIRSI